MNINHSHKFKIKSLGIDTYRENILFIRSDSLVCKAEGFAALKRIQVHHNEKTIIATLNVIYSDLIADGEASLSLEALSRLNVKDGDTIGISHLKPVESLSKVRAKMYGQELSAEDFGEIIPDIVAGHYSNIELSAFITSCSADNLSVNEITGLTRAMIRTGKKIIWGKGNIFDKHCVGGLPGYRTTPIVVSIVAAAGLTIPKTSSRAITSPAGTADTMETMSPVNLSVDELREVVEKTGGCVAWGGAVKLSPADDIIISVERSLDIDSLGQMIASVLSKKAAAGSTHVLIDIPVGPTAKVRSEEEAEKLKYYFTVVGKALGLQIKILVTDGTQPVGRGIGPALEAMDVLSVLRNEPDAPADLKERSLFLAANLLELSGNYPNCTGAQFARNLLENGGALKKFNEICQAQGGFTEPGYASHCQHIYAEKAGKVISIDNRRLARLAKLAGAPKAPRAGIQFFAPIGKQVQKGDVLFSLFSESEGEINYALEYYSTYQTEIIKLA